MNPSTENRSPNVASTLRKLNHYQRLGLKTNAVTQAEIENAFRSRLALFHSVDANMSIGEINEADQLIRESLAVLQNSQLRKQYDRELEAASATAKPVAATKKENLDWSTRYQLGKKISESERSQTFRALDTRLNRQVIVKQLRPELVGSASHDQLFREQAALYAGCNSGKLVTILDYDIKTGSIVLETLSHDLSTVSTQYVGNFDAVRDILRDVLQGLVFLHSHGCAHGRIELQHLLVDNMGGIKLAITPGMTGSATALRPSPQAVHVAPEMLNSIVFGQPDLASDIYTLGFAALELLCGKRLAAKVSPTLSSDQLAAKNWLLWHSSPAEHLPPISSIVRGVPDDLGELLQRMTNKQQQERFRNAKECLEFMAQRRDAHAIAAPSDSANEVDEGVEVFGTPPTLHQTYQSEVSSTWSQIIRDPKLLLKPSGRKQLNYLGLGCLIAASLGFVLQPASSSDLDPGSDLNDDIHQVANAQAERLPEQFITDESDASAHTLKTSINDSEPIETSLALGSEVAADAEVAAEDAELVEAPEDDAASIVQESPSTTATELSGLGEPPMDALSSSPAVQQPERSDPYADVRGRTYTPVPQRFRYCGEANDLAARAQIEAVRNLLEQLKSGTHKFDAGQVPFVLPDRALDPRVSFSMALWAHRTGSRRLAVEYCRKSIRDAMNFDVPFVLPLQLLNHLHAEAGEFAPALAECRTVCQWVGHKRLHVQGFEAAGEEVAWWLGTLVGFLQHAKAAKYHAGTDIPHTIEVLNRVSSHSQLEKYRIAHMHVYDTCLAVTAEWDRQQGHRDTWVPVPDNGSQQPSLFRRWLESRYFGISACKPSAHTVSPDYESPGRSLADQRTEVAEEAKPRMKRVRHPITAPSPGRLSTYHACDVTAFASQTLDTLGVGSGE